MPRKRKRRATTPKLQRRTRSKARKKRMHRPRWCQTRLPRWMRERGIRSNRSSWCIGRGEEDASQLDDRCSHLLDARYLMQRFVQSPRTPVLPYATT